MTHEETVMTGELTSVNQMSIMPLILSVRVNSAVDVTQGPLNRFRPVAGEIFFGGSFGPSRRIVFCPLLVASHSSLFLRYFPALERLSPYTDSLQMRAQLGSI